jgi:hypothetical protein
MAWLHQAHNTVVHLHNRSSEDTAMLIDRSYFREQTAIITSKLCKQAGRKAQYRFLIT